MGASTPLPTKSSIHNQKNWRIRTKRVMKKVAMKGPIKDLTISISSFLNNGMVASYAAVSFPNGETSP